MITLILGTLALAAIAAILVLSPSEPWEINGEVWYEQFAPKSRRDTFSEELVAMRLDAELLHVARPEAGSPVRQPARPARPVTSASA